MSESNLYYFYTVGCGFCKKAEPLVDELNKEGHNILKLDLAEKENKVIVEDIKKEHDIKCGTPLFVNAETGHYVCGYREKDIMLKWLNGEDIPPTPRPKTPMPRPPFHGVSKGEENNWKVEYEEWADENSHLPNLKTADELLAMPRPRSQPPPPPRPDSTDKEKNEWKIKYEKWVKENDHMPNLISADAIMSRMNQGPSQLPGRQALPQQLERRIALIETKLTKLMNHLGVK